MTRLVREVGECFDGMVRSADYNGCMVMSVVDVDVGLAQAAANAPLSSIDNKDGIVH
jgi:hypothetical protein